MKHNKSNLKRGSPGQGEAWVRPKVCELIVVSGVDMMILQETKEDGLQMFNSTAVWWDHLFDEKTPVRNHTLIQNAGSGFSPCFPYQLGNDTL